MIHGTYSSYGIYSSSIPYCDCPYCNQSVDPSDEEEALLEEQMGELIRCPSFLGEVPMNAEESAAAAEAIEAGDMAELGRIFLRAAEREGGERLEAMTMKTSDSELGCARRLVAMYRSEADQIIKGTADLVPAQHQTMGGEA